MQHAALSMAMDMPVSHRKTVGADKNYDTKDLNEALRALITPHPAAKQRTSLDRRIKEIFGWLKTVGPMRKVHVRGRRKVEWLFRFALTAYNLARIRNLTEAMA